MAITDLTGTSWELFGFGYDAYQSDGWDYDINFVSNNKNFHHIAFQYMYMPPAPPHFPGDGSGSLEYSGTTEGVTVSTFDLSSGGYAEVSSDYQIISITGGTDATDTDLINWLEANATQIQTGYSITYHSDGGTPTPGDLTGQTNLPSPLPTISKSGYTFDGWYLDSSFQTPAVAGAEISADTDLYAKFTASTITLDLSTIGLHDGAHSIQLRLSDEGLTKVDSDLSEAVTYEISSWEYPVQDGDTLLITQAYLAEQTGDTLYIE